MKPSQRYERSLTKIEEDRRKLKQHFRYLWRGKATIDNRSPRSLYTHPNGLYRRSKSSSNVSHSRPKLSTPTRNPPRVKAKADIMDQHPYEFAQPEKPFQPRTLLMNFAQSKVANMRVYQGPVKRSQFKPHHRETSTEMHTKTADILEIGDNRSESDKNNDELSKYSDDEFSSSGAESSKSGSDFSGSRSDRNQSGSGNESASGSESSHSSSHDSSSKQVRTPSKRQEWRVPKNVDFDNLDLTPSEIDLILTGHIRQVVEQIDTIRLRTKKEAKKPKLTKKPPSKPFTSKQAKTKNSTISNSPPPSELSQMVKEKADKVEVEAEVEDDQTIQIERENSESDLHIEHYENDNQQIEDNQSVTNDEISHNSHDVHQEESIQSGDDVSDEASLMPEEEIGSYQSDSEIDEFIPTNAELMPNVDNDSEVENYDDLNNKPIDTQNHQEIRQKRESFLSRLAAKQENKQMADRE